MPPYIPVFLKSESFATYILPPFLQHEQGGFTSNYKLETQSRVLDADEARLISWGRLFEARLA